MKPFRTKYTFLVTVLLAWAGAPVVFASGYAQAAKSIAADGARGPAAHADPHPADEGSQAHTLLQKAHGKEARAHDDGDHHDHDAHHGHEDEHEEGRTRIAAEAAKRMGIVVEVAGAALIDETIPLAGRIVLDENTRVKVPARFPGVVRSVQAGLGQYVEEGQVLAVVEANESMREYDVVAPISGHVLERNTNRGDVAGSEPLFVIADFSNVWAKFHVFPRDVVAVRSGQAVQASAFHGGKSQEAKIDRFLPLADGTSQTHTAISVVANADGRWKPGMAVEGRVTLAQERVPVAVKEGALQKLEELGDVVFVREEEDVYEARPVKLGAQGGGYVQILEGLEPGQSYVSEGSFIIKSDILKSTAAHSH